MAKTSLHLIEALRNTAKKLQQNQDYQWGHMGSCNCGHLAQEITRLSKSEIHSRAMNKYGDWNEQLNDYCPTSGLLMDDLITQMIDFGLDTDDLKHLEKLSDTKILKRLPQADRYLQHNRKQDVIIYINAWADLLEDELLKKIKLPKTEHAMV
ncbi:hypothetical protein GCM10009122_08080 [Fulvivirga kasyanovii]|uniref:Uncharacterized protein n=1 Tax=Fulvivirga kasyanovii TaxID=396812 RepID=A0ABW9RPV5_9BACT|nr:hypothetical protein [Fulvivirga kasyanovii]MTI25782.1 hypothetical protein [Fulvivirga kasyanovii]